MKIKVNDTRSELAKKSDKLIIIGTILKVVFPGTGIGSLVSANGWLYAIMDATENSDAYRETMLRAGFIPKNAKLTEEEAAKKVVEFLNKTKGES